MGVLKPGDKYNNPPINKLSKRRLSTIIQGPDISDFDPGLALDVFFGKKKRRPKQCARNYKRSEKPESCLDGFWNNPDMWMEMEN